MALRIVDGYNGKQLRAELPVRDGSYADVALDDGTIIRLIYDGGRANGHAAPSPDPSLRGNVKYGALARKYDRVQRSMRAEVSELQESVTQATLELERHGRTPDEIGSVLWIAQERIHYLSSLLHKSPIFPSVTLGIVAALDDARIHNTET